MTFRSLTIEAHPDRESAYANYLPGCNYETVCSLNAVTFPQSAVVFAMNHNLFVYYVDNCWARVAIDGRLVKTFMSLGLGTEPGLAAHLVKIADDGWYVIEEEEF